MTLSLAFRHFRFWLAKRLINEPSFEQAATEAYDAALEQYESEFGAPPDVRTCVAMRMALAEFTPLQEYSGRPDWWPPA